MAKVMTGIALARFGIGQLQRSRPARCPVRVTRCGAGRKRFEAALLALGLARRSTKVRNLASLCAWRRIHFGGIDRECT